MNISKDVLERIVKTLDGVIAEWGHRQIVRGLTEQERTYLEQLKEDRLALVEALEARPVLHPGLRPPTVHGYSGRATKEG